jgi:quercetin dioxygenase-like cupin family protein
MKNTDDTMGSVALPKIPEIVPESDAITVKKDDGTKVSYYIFPEFEVHANTIVAGTAQNWHYHKAIEEIIFVTSGQIEVLWLNESKQKESKTLSAGDLCRLGGSVHNIANQTKETATFLVYRLIPTGKNQHALIKGDRYAAETK